MHFFQEAIQAHFEPNVGLEEASSAMRPTYASGFDIIMQ